MRGWLLVVMLGASRLVVAQPSEPAPPDPTSPAPAPTPAPLPPPEPYRSPPPQPQPQPQPSPQPYRPPLPPPEPYRSPPPIVDLNWSEPRIRYAIGAGFSGSIVERDDLQPMVGFEATYFDRLSDLLSVGFNFHISLRNFQVISDFYGDLSNSKTTDKSYGYLFGWLSGTGFLSTGPELVFGAAKPQRGWISVGTSLFIAIDTREASDEAILGHAGRLGAGYDFSDTVGVSFRVNYAPSNGATIFGTTGPSVLMMMATIDLRAYDKKKH